MYRMSKSVLGMYQLWLEDARICLVMTTHDTFVATKVKNI